MNYGRTAAGMSSQTNGQTGSSTGVVSRDSSEGQATWALGSLFQQIITDQETGGYGLSRVTQRPGTATPVHVHSREAEAFYLLDGTMTYLAGEQTYQLGPGSFIYLPAGIPHAFRVTGDSPVQFLAIVAGPLMSMYDEVGRPAGQLQLPEPDADELQADIGRWLEAAPRYGIQVIGPPLPA
jgi:quercetin dioxygenase-like cupin family protein